MATVPASGQATQPVASRGEDDGKAASATGPGGGHDQASGGRRRWQFCQSYLLWRSGGADRVDRPHPQRCRVVLSGCCRLAAFLWGAQVYSRAGAPGRSATVDGDETFLRRQAPPLALQTTRPPLLAGRGAGATPTGNGGGPGPLSQNALPPPLLSANRPISCPPILPPRPT